ncbi:MAG TPA: MerR family transcriptional regulator [Dehalococcoidia bacterium]|nr:MerR family transcriptional regulator [Dehalococcoidia bacterium]
MADARKPARDEPCLQIGEVADRTGVTQRTLRFYEERGLLKPPTRMEGGFRLYSEDDVVRVEQIKRLQSLLGLTLAEIKDMVEAEEIQEELNATYRPDLEVAERIQRLQKRIAVTQRQSDIISTKLAAMEEMKQEVDEKLERFRARLTDLEKRRDEVASGATG